MDMNARLMSQHVHWLVFTYLVAIFLCGLLGNVAILYIYGCRMKSTTFGMFVQVLAVVDLSSVLLSVPGSFVFRLFSPALDTSRMCKFLIFMNHFNSSTAGLLLSIIAVQRYRKVCKPHNAQITRTLATKLCVGAVCLSAALSTPIILVAEATHPSVTVGNRTYLVLKGNGQSIIYALLVDAEFLGITVVLAVLYSLIGKTMKARVKAWRHSKSGRVPNSVATKVFFILTVVFILTVLPMMVISTWLSFCRIPPTLTLTSQVLLDIATYLPFANSIVNPLVYSFTSKLFRSELFAVLRVRRNAGTSGNDTTHKPSSDQTGTSSV